MLPHTAIVLIPYYQSINTELLQTLRDLDLRPLTIKSSDIIFARSMLLSLALDHDTDRIVFIDSDMVPTAADIDTLIESEKVTPLSALTGSYLVRGNKIAAALSEDKEGNTDRYLRIRGAGLGFSCFHTDSISRMCTGLPKLYSQEYQHDWWPFTLPFIDYSSTQRRYTQEDFALWHRLKSMTATDGWIDTKLVIAHEKSVLVGIKDGMPHIGSDQ